MKNEAFILSDQTKNSYGFSVLTAGIKIDRFLKNPVMLYNHDINDVPGQWTDIKKDGDRLTAVPKFDDDDRAQYLSKKVESGTLRGASMGLHVLKLEMGVPGFPEDEPVATESELIESSLTPIPSNSNALKLFDKNGVLLSADQVLTILSNNQPQNDMKKLSFFVAALQLANINLSADASEDDVLKAVQKLAKDFSEAEGKVTTLSASKTELTTKLTALEAAGKDAKKAKELSLVDKAVAAGKITADKKDQYVKLAAADFEATESILDSMPVRTSLSAAIAGAATGKAAAEKYADWDFKKLHREAPLELERIKKEDAAKYKQLFDAAYSKA